MDCREKRKAKLERARWVSMHPRRRCFAGVEIYRARSLTTNPDLEPSAVAKLVKYPARLRKTLDALPNKRARNEEDARRQTAYEAERKRRIREAPNRGDASAMATATMMMVAAILATRRRG
jgi:hypothetical protein